MPETNLSVPMPEGSEGSQTVTITINKEHVDMLERYIAMQTSEVFPGRAAGDRYCKDGKFTLAGAVSHLAAEKLYEEVHGD